MADTLLSGIKGSTKDITVALFISTNPELPKIMSDKEIEKATLADMLLARAGEIMLKRNAPELLQALDANIKSISATSAKIPTTVIKQSEDVQSKFNNYENMRQSLERQLMEYANHRKAEMREVIQAMLEGKITRDVAVNKLKDLDKKTEHLRTKIEAVSKDFEPIKNAQTKTLEEIFKTIPGKNLAELQKLLHPEADTPRPE